MGGCAQQHKERSDGASCGVKDLAPGSTFSPPTSFVITAVFIFFKKPPPFLATFLLFILFYVLLLSSRVVCLFGWTFFSIRRAVVLVIITPLCVRILNYAFKRGNAQFAVIIDSSFEWPVVLYPCVELMRTEEQ